MRLADDRDPKAQEQVSELFPHTGKAHIVGITGNPGAGKSSLCNALISGWRAQGKRVGIVAIDPSSPFSGGAVLGDRIRMQRHATDPGVFIRSLATRGALGGLSRSAGDIALIMDAMGMDIVAIETVGVGQDEVDVVRTAHTTVVVMVPGLGDEVQILKAGILEIADVFAVNKADRPGADRLAMELEAVQQLASTPRPIPVLPTVAVRQEGIEALIDAITQHRQYLMDSGEFQSRESRRLMDAVASLVQEHHQREFKARFAALELSQNLTARLLRRELTPHAAASLLLS